MKTLICLVRHGQTDWNRAHLIQGRFDNPLNDTGKEQLYQTGLKIKNLNITWDVYLSSPLSRAIESQQIIKNVLTGSKDNIIIRPNLIEREFGDADGKPIEEKIYQDIMNDNIYGMETSKDIQTRALKEINDLAKRNAIMDKTGFNVTRAIEINHESKEVEESEVNTKQRRAAAPKVNTAEPEAVGRRTAAPKYGIKK